MSIRHQQEFTRFIIERGVGINDSVASSTDSYLSYLRSLSKILNTEINELTLGSEDDVQRIVAAIKGSRKPKTVSNYTSAMRQYVSMIQSMNLNLDARRTNDYRRNVNTGSERELNMEKQENPMQYDSVNDDKHFLHSSFREKLLEHLFVAELLKRNWLEHSCDLEIAKPEVDGKGYDLIAEKGGIVRHIQLKSTKRGGNASSQDIHIALSAKPSGCVVWLEFDERTLAMGPFRFLGGKPGMQLPSLEKYPVAKHSKANAEGKKTQRPQLRRIKKNQFELINDFDELYLMLFG